MGPGTSKVFRTPARPPAALASRSGPASGSCQAPWRPPAKPPALSGPLPGHLPCFLHRFGRPKDLPGHQKPMIFMILSSKINVSRISTKSTFGITFGPLREHFGHHFGRLCAPWGPFGAPWAGKAVQKLSKSRKKSETMMSWIGLGAPRGQKNAKRAPGSTKWTPKVRKKTPKHENTHASNSQLCKRG